jgi:putative transcriptional regulator
MAIRVQLDRILLERRMSLTELADRVGVTIANLSILKTGKARAIRFSTLDALCRELNCQPGDLVAFEPGPPDDPPDVDEESDAYNGA